jgi:hypothetical protein
MTKARGLADLGNAYSDGALSNRNLIINGAMQVAQRGVSATGVNSNQYVTVDRFIVVPTNLGTWTVEQSTDAPDGFASSLKMTCTTAEASPIAAAHCGIGHKIEAQNLQSLGYGSSASKDITISFWVKSNKTGNASFEIQQKDNSNAQVTPQYSITSANTWEYKTITVGGDASGIIDNDNDIGLFLRWWLNTGSNYTGGTNQTVYTAQDDTDRNASNLGVGGATSDYFAITGVQLEVGDTATPFEHRSYGQELALCQRYYFDASDANLFLDAYQVAAGYSSIYVAFPTTMRAAPSMFVSNGGSYNVQSFVGSSVTAVGCRLEMRGSAAGRFYVTNVYYRADAEL